MDVYSCIVIVSEVKPDFWQGTTYSLIEYLQPLLEYIDFQVPSVQQKFERTWTFLGLPLHGYTTVYRAAYILLCLILHI